MTVWSMLREFLESHVLPEERMYRGETGVRMKDVEALFDAIRKGDPKTHAPYSDDPKVLSAAPSPEGDVVEVSYPVDPRVWGRWSRSPNFAAIMGSTKDEPHPGRPKGGTVMKRTYGGRVIFQPGPPSTGHERMPSAMDRYDVMMVGDVEGAAVPDTGNVQLPTHGKSEASIVVRRIAWSPAIGSTEERQARLKSLLMGGQAGPLRRRPQPGIPEPSKKDVEKALGQHPADVPRFGTAGRLGMGGRDRGVRKGKPED